MPLQTRYTHELGLRYKPFHWDEFGVLAISCTIFSMLSSSTSTASWAWFGILTGNGVGSPLTIHLLAIQAVLREADITAATSMYSFTRSFGFVWGTAIPYIVFNSRIEAGLQSFEDPKVKLFCCIMI